MFFDVGERRGWRELMVFDVGERGWNEVAKYFPAKELEMYVGAVRKVGRSVSCFLVRSLSKWEGVHWMERTGGRQRAKKIIIERPCTRK